MIYVYYSSITRVVVGKQNENVVGIGGVEPQIIVVRC